MSGEALPKIGAPAERALAALGVTELSDLCRFAEEDVLAQHGIGPRAVAILKQRLAEEGLTFRPPAR